MASAQGSASEQVVSFDIFEGDILDSSTILTENLTQEEKEEMYVLVNELEAVNSRELIDFATQQNATTAETHPHHKLVTSDELDHLAGINSAEQTKYQTKWAIAVIKGTFYTPNCLIFTKHGIGDFLFLFWLRQKDILSSALQSEACRSPNDINLLSN